MCSEKLILGRTRVEGSGALSMIRKMVFSSRKCGKERGGSVKGAAKRRSGNHSHHCGLAVAAETVLEKACES